MTCGGKYRKDTTAGKYASQRFTGSCAAQPKGCSTYFVPTIASNFGDERGGVK